MVVPSGSAVPSRVRFAEIIYDLLRGVDITCICPDLRVWLASA